MKKDYVYQDKGQFKLLQNAERIGDFIVGDQDIVPSERVLPEQRFAHQPIFRRPPEELVTTFSYIHNFNQGVFSPTNHNIRVANLFKKSSTTNPDGVHLLYKYTGWVDAPYLQSILLKNWSAEALAVEYFHAPGVGWIPIANNSSETGPGVVLKSNRAHFPIFFKDYVFFKPINFADGILYSKLNTKKTETKEIKVAIRDYHMQFFSLGWLYKDDADTNYGYKMVAYKQDGGLEWPTDPNPNYSINLVQYKANSLEGPWVYDKTWNTWDPPTVYSSPAYTAIIQELASLILSKTHKELSISVSDSLPGSDWAFQDVFSEAYDPPYNTGYAGIYSRGDEGEIVRVDEAGSLKNYLIKRLGNGQMKKTLITDIDQGFLD